MTVINKPGLTIAIGIPALIFTACALITHTTKFREHSDRFSLAITIDLLLTAPLAYYLVIRKSTLSKLTVLRVFIVGVLLAGVLLSKNNVPVLGIIKTWISPLLEVTLIGFIVWKFYVANKHLKTVAHQRPDFLLHCRSILKTVFGSEKIGNVLASEVAVFYYTFSKKAKAIDYKTSFTSYKENGIILILSTFLGIFIIETAGMHLLFMLWNKTAAWILTSLTLYTCMQLFAHIKALRARPIIIDNNHLLLRNGLMGGDAIISLDNIEKIETTNKPLTGEGVIKLAFIKGLENHNLAVYLLSPVTVIKAFGIKKMAKILLVNIDKQKDFMKAFENFKNNNII